MRRIIGYKPLMLATAVMLMAGCSNSPSPDLADGSSASEAKYNAAKEAVDLAASESAAAGSRATDATEAALEQQTPLVDGADSDDPGTYLVPSADRANEQSTEQAQPSNETAENEEAPKNTGRAADGDDPDAPLIVAKKVELPDDVPLDNGREPSVQPIPEGQRVAVASTSVAPAASELGRDPDAKPGDEVKRPVPVAPTAKPAAPVRETLADLSEALQALDKDGDGQLGVYEWPREKLAEFKKLDADKDGFLTPAELVAGQKKAADPEAATTDDKPAAASELKPPAEKAKEEAAPKTDDDSKPEEAKAPATDTTDKEEKKEESKEEKKEESKEESKEEAPAASSDEADSKDDSSADDQPTQGS